MIISHVKIIAFQTIINIACGYFILVENTCSLYNKQKIYKFLLQIRLRGGLNKKCEHNLFSHQYCVVPFKYKVKIIHFKDSITYN